MNSCKHGAVNGGQRALVAASVPGDEACEEGCRRRAASKASALPGPDRLTAARPTATAA
jgi:hypothetical protein